MSLCAICSWSRTAKSILHKIKIHQRKLYTGIQVNILTLFTILLLQGINRLGTKSYKKTNDDGKLLHTVMSITVLKHPKQFLDWCYISLQKLRMRWWVLCIQGQLVEFLNSISTNALMTYKHAIQYIIRIDLLSKWWSHIQIMSKLFNFICKYQ